MEEEEKQEQLRIKIRAVLTFLMIVVISILIIVIGHNKYSFKDKSDAKYLKAEITSVFENELTEEEIDEENARIDISFEARLTENGEVQKSTVFGRQVISALMSKKTIKEGDKVLLTKNEGSEIYSFVDYDKTNLIIILIVVLTVLSIVVGLWKGFKAIVALVLNALLIFLVYIPAIILGANIYLATVLLVMYITISDSIFLNGFNKKTLSSVISTIFGTFIVASITILLNKVFMITGITSESAALFTMNNPELNIDLIGIIWAGIVLGTLGAVISIATYISYKIREKLEEISDNLDKDSFKILYKLGIEEGRRKIAPMFNTLIFAFAGGTLSILIFYIANSKNYFYLLNSEQTIVLITQLLIASLGILIIIPITSLLSTAIELKKKKEGRKFVQKYSEGLSLDLGKKKDKGEE